MSAQLNQELGNCYEVVGNFAIDAVFLNLPIDLDDMRICHGKALGTGGDALGLRYGHAWIEYADGKMVIEMSNGNDVMIAAHIYYEAGNIKNVRRYTIGEAKQFMRDTGHYGPWEE